MRLKESDDGQCYGLGVVEQLIALNFCSLVFIYMPRLPQITYRAGPLLSVSKLREGSARYSVVYIVPLRPLELKSNSATWTILPLC